MAPLRYRIKDGAAKAFLRDELAMREEMGEQARRLDTTKTLLEECRQKRALAATDERPFVQQWDYGRWRSRAERAVENAGEMLADPKPVRAMSARERQRHTQGGKNEATDHGFVGSYLGTRFVFACKR